MADLQVYPKFGVCACNALGAIRCYPCDQKRMKGRIFENI